MALSHGEASVTTSAAQLRASAQATAVALFAPSTNGGTTYVGGAGVTTATGFPIAAGASLMLDVGDSGSVYLVGTSGDKIRYLASNPS